MELDYRCFIILEELGEKDQWVGELHYETKPTTYSALQKRIRGLVEAGLVEETVYECYDIYNISAFGKKVLSEINMLVD
jgi:DNA-binding HxlR family transcriptional regulator